MKPTNGRTRAPDPTLLMESDIPAGQTIAEYRRVRVLRIDAGLKRRWVWRLVHRA